MSARGGPPAVVREHAPAKVNLVLQVGARRDDGLHELCSLFASIDLADELTVSVGSAPDDAIRCAGVAGPNLCATALDAYRDAVPGALPQGVDVEVVKRIPVAAGLGGGSADAAAVLRAANELAGGPLSEERLRAVAAEVGADVPSQVRPAHALVEGAGERVEPLALPPLWLVLVPQEEGLSTAAVYREADRLGSTRGRLDPDRVRSIAAASPQELADGLENDLEAAALSLRPELAGALAELRRAGALGALVTGSGPTVLGIFADEPTARAAAGALSGAMVTRVRG